jgi:putative Mg2+ transporter-C (MgtC) family protein
MPDPLTLTDISLRLLAAIGCGAVLGMEREWADKPAGLRTQMLVALGSATFIVMTLSFTGREGMGDAIRLDPTRVVQGIVGGIGFLGAGSIIQNRGGVRGLTTAATIWIVGALGIACGLGYYELAGIAAGYALLVLMVIGAIEKRINTRRGRNRHPEADVSPPD